MGVYQDMFYDRMSSLRKSKVPFANSHTMLLDNPHIGDPHLEKDPHPRSGNSSTQPFPVLVGSVGILVTCCSSLISLPINRTPEQKDGEKPTPAAHFIGHWEMRHGILNP